MDKTRKVYGYFWSINKLNIKNLRGKRIRIFGDNSYKLYLVNKFRTSCICSICKEEIGRCDKIIVRKNPNLIKVVIY